MERKNDARGKGDARVACLRYRFRLAAVAIRLNPALFARLESVHERRAGLGLDRESVRLVQRYHKDFVLAGAAIFVFGIGPVERVKFRGEAL